VSFACRTRQKGQQVFAISQADKAFQPSWRRGLRSHLPLDTLLFHGGIFDRRASHTMSQPPSLVNRPNALAEDINPKEADGLPMKRLKDLGDREGSAAQKQARR